MGTKGKPIPRELFLGDWMEFFDVGPVELATAAHCSHSYISNMAAKRRGGINALFLLPISEHLGITVNALYQPPPTKAQAEKLQQYDEVTQGAILARVRRLATR